MHIVHSIHNPSCDRTTTRQRLIAATETPNSGGTSFPLTTNRFNFRLSVTEMASQADFRDRQFLAVIGDEASRFCNGTGAGNVC